MFENKRYMTRKIATEIPLEIIFKLWDKINFAKKLTQLDYLQIFELRNENVAQKIVHRQEKPPFEHIDYLLIDNPINAKIYVIDEGAYSTMLFANEY